MPRLFDDLKQSARQWRQDGYVCDEYPLIGEILGYQMESGELENPSLHFLRQPQFLALEIYFYVRLVLKTPRTIDLYKHYYGADKQSFFEALGVPLSSDARQWAEIDAVIETIKSDLDWVKEKRIQALHEALILNYPSYILALAMGAGKTVLIGAIVATEFALSLRYPGGDFMRNALVFAPGTTIIESLRELSDLPYEKILPPALHRDFAANLKIEYPSSDKEIQSQRGSSYNLIISNTEKISLRARRRSNQGEFGFREKELQANLRLQTIVSLPRLGIFSDEAHHTYGNTFEKLKRVRETINYIDEQTDIVAVINTTGTPYYRKQPLKEVIVWYGLGDGIKDSILKELDNGIHRYDIGEQSEQTVVDDIVMEFFSQYGEVSLPDGAKAKIAFYFKTQEHLDHSRILIEQAMTRIGANVAQILVNTQQSSPAEIDIFKRLNNPGNQKRVILLIGKGVEGWNCPSLFACALIKEQTRSNNYVLQAATRCLRQVPGNRHSAKIFLDSGNAGILDKELQDNFATDLDRLGAETKDRETVTLRIRKTELPRLEITRTIKRAVRSGNPSDDIVLKRPEAEEAPATFRSILKTDFSGSGEILLPTGDRKKLPAATAPTDRHTIAWKLATRYHLPILPILKALDNLYPGGEIAESHLYGLFKQVEEQQANHETVEEKVSEVLALIRVRDEDGKDLFETDENGVYVHRLRLLKRTHTRMKKDGLFIERDDYPDSHDLSFHYTPYNFDSQPERSFFRQILSMLETNPDEVAAFLFTGG